MKNVRLIDGMDYPEDIPEKKPMPHLLAAEVIVRLQELDEIDGGDESGGQPAGIRLINRLVAVERRSRRAYRLILDMIGQQRSFSESLECLASNHINADGQPTSRQSWLQNAQADVEVITIIYPEMGKVVGELLKRRTEKNFM